MIVLDTHAWVWWVADPDALSAPARHAIERAADNAVIYVSSISVWEVAALVARGRLRLAIDVRAWLKQCEALPYLRFLPIDSTIALHSVFLPDFPHRDPADRFIVATALSLGAPLVTKDRRLHEYPHVNCVW